MIVVERRRRRLVGGLLRRGKVGGEVGRDYYWNASTGMAMWEHPHVAVLCGVAKRLTEARRAETKNLAAAVAVER